MFVIKHLSLRKENNIFENLILTFPFSYLSKEQMVYLITSTTLKSQL